MKTHYNQLSIFTTSCRRLWTLFLNETIHMVRPNTPTRKFLGTGWQFPIRINPHGGLNLSSGEQNVAESIWLILATAQNERQMRPLFGCGMHELVFAPNNPSTFGNVSHLVRKALTEYEPRIDVLEVRVGSEP